MKKEEVTFLIADDSAIVLEGINALLNSEGFYNLDFVKDGVKVLSKLQKKKYSILLMDIRMKHKTGIQVLANIQELELSQKTIIFSSYTEVNLILDVFKYNALGYISKTFLAQKLITAITTVLNGEIYLSNDIQKIITYHNLKFKNRKLEPYNLSNQQLEILEMFVSGYNANEIAIEKKLSSGSIRNQFYRIREKFNIKSNIGIALKYMYLKK